ncbi:MAG: hypothetical protein ACYSWQ_21120 [Planctomycetota bacterium]|jgi:protocatechuate 3,4-dioxygenase beta subunit
MDGNCERIREEIPELIGAGLSPEKAVELEQHRSQCPACNKYFEALASDDRLLREFARGLQPSVARLETVVIDELRRRRFSGKTQTFLREGRILNTRTTLIAAAILIVAAILIGAVMFRGPGEKPVEMVKQPDEPGMAAPEAPKQDEPDLEAIAQAELQDIQRMIAASDVAGVTAMLNDGQLQSKIAAANYLATTGDARLIGVLAQLVAEWKGEPARNPFAAAITQIMTRIHEQEQEGEPVDDEEDTTVAETTAVKGEQDIECKGVVADERGRPIGGARVLLYHNRSRWGLDNRVMEETTSTADGSFACRQHIEFRPIEQLSYTQEAYVLMARHSEYVLVATHPDYAFGWRNTTRDSEQDAYRIVLTKPISQGIAVTDRGGNPLAGVRIWLHNAGDSKSPKAFFRDDLIVATDAGFAGATTDAAGRAVIRNLPDTHCSFRVTLKGYAEAVVMPVERITRISLSRGASVSGWVLKEGSVPVVGAIINLKPNWMNDCFLAVSDINGYFHLEDLPARGWEPPGDSEAASGAYTVTIKHEQCAAQPADVILLPGQSIDEFLIEASSDTTLVECQVVEFGTDVPVAGARIHGSNRIGKFSGYSDSEGIFVARVLPGLVQLSFHLPPKGVYVLDERKPDESLLSFDATGEKMAVTLKTPPIAGFLRNVSGIVLGPDGMAQSEGETIVYAGAGKIKTSIGSRTERPVWVDGDGRFELKEVPAGRKLHLYVATKDHSLAATDVLEIPDDPAWSDYLAVNLEPTRSASVVVSDESGNVVPDTEFRIGPMVEGRQISSVNLPGRTDENGLLELDGVVPGLEYYLRSIEPGMSTDSSLEAIGEIITLKMVLVPLEP